MPKKWKRKFHHLIVKPIKRMVLLPEITRRNWEYSKNYFSEKFHLEYVVQIQEEEIEKTRREKDELLEAHEKMTKAYQEKISKQEKAMKILQAQVEETSAIALRSLGTRAGKTDPSALKEYGIERIVADSFRALQSENEKLLQQVECLESARIPDLMEGLSKYNKEFKKIPILIMDKNGKTVYSSQSFTRKAKERLERIKELALKNRISIDYQNFIAEYSEQRLVEDREPYLILVLRNHPNRYEGKLRKAASRKYHNVLNILKRISIKFPKSSPDNLY